jgi:hypothetical protein
MFEVVVDGQQVVVADEARNVEREDVQQILPRVGEQLSNSTTRSNEKHQKKGGRTDGAAIRDPNKESEPEPSN